MFSLLRLTHPGLVAEARSLLQDRPIRNPGVRCGDTNGAGTSLSCGRIRKRYVSVSVFAPMR